MSNQAVKKHHRLRRSGGMDRFQTSLNVGNKIPDPAILFFWALVIVWVASALLSNLSFD